MNSSAFHPAIQSPQPALELISLAKLSADAARQNLRALLLENPDYFGRITGSSFKAVLRIQEDATYECLSRLGYNPQLDLLEAVITLNKSDGYSIASRGYGSVEFVRFYLSLDGGFSWRDQGLRYVKVFDVPSERSRDYVVTAGIGRARTFCFIASLPRVRAILSWNSAPPRDAPDWTPVWGHVLDAQIQIDEFSGAALDELVRPGWMSMPTRGAIA